MEEDKKVEFNLPALLLVTGFCFLAFAFVLKTLDHVNIKFFLWFGCISFISGAFTAAFMLLEKNAEKRKVK